MFDQNFLTTITMVFGLGYITSHIWFLNRSIRLAKWRWGAIAFLGATFGLLMSSIALIATFFFFAIIFGPPLQENSWPPIEKRIIYGVMLGQVLALGIGSGGMSANVFNRLH